MSYGSFYGGRKGSSFILAKSYPDIMSMVLDFSRGGDFSDVKYDEYVLINTANRNHPDNGKLFKRGYDYNSSRTITGYRAYNGNNEEIINGSEEDYTTARYQFDDAISAGGAVYIGTIAGPAGNSPFLSLTTYNEVETYYNNAPSSKKTRGQGSISNQDLLPGKTDTGTYNDDILWYSASIISDNSDEGQAYIGFKVPYLVIDFEKSIASPYQEAQVSRIDEKQHPFYEKWEIAIPKGKHGNGISEIKKINIGGYFSDDAAAVALLPHIYLSPSSTEPMTAEDFQAAGLSNSDDILVYNYCNYEESDPPEEKLCFLTQYNQVSSVNISEDGSLEIFYTSQQADRFEKILSRITKLSYNDESDEEKGLLKIEYNTGQNVSIPIVYTDVITLKENGTLAYKKNIEDIDVLQEPDENHILGKIKWIKEIEYDNDQKTLKVYYNTEGAQQDQNEVDQFKLQVITDIKIEDNGEVKIKKDNEEWQNLYYQSNGEIFPRILKWITDIVYNSDQDRMDIYLNGDYQGQPSTSISNAFHRIVNVTFEEEIVFDDVTPAVTAPGFIITYSNGDTTKVRFSTGKLIKRMDFIPGEAQVEDEITTYTNTFLEITYTDNSVDLLELTGKLINTVQIVDKSSIISEDGITVPRSQLRVTYDNGETETLNFAYPRSIIVDDETIDNSHRIKVYDSQGNKTFQSNPINGISQLMINSNRLLILYDNPTARDNIPNQRAVQIEQGDGTTLRWDNLGLVRTDSGILVGKNIAPSDVEDPFSTEAEIIEYLNTNFANGQVIGTLYRIITVGEEGQNKKFYGYDTLAGSWYFLGTIGNSAIGKDCVIGTQEEFNSATNYKKALLRQDGIFFIITSDDDDE